MDNPNPAVRGCNLIAYLAAAVFGAVVYKYKLKVGKGLPKNAVKRIPEILFDAVNRHYNTEIRCAHIFHSLSDCLSSRFKLCEKLRIARLNGRNDLALKICERGALHLNRYKHKLHIL